MAVGRRTIGWIAATIAVVVVAGYAVAQGMMGQNMTGPGMMMGGGAANRPVGAGWGGDILNYQQAAAYIQQGNEIGDADQANNAITYSGKEVTIDLVAVQPDHEDQTFEVHGLINPTLVIPSGAVVHLNLINMDYGPNMEHSIVLTSAAPPYPYMSMMVTGRGLTEPMPLLPWRSGKAVEGAQYASLGMTFVAQQPGTYWYVCPTPKHAQEGMYGKFVVR
ncbi:MAG: hypothetical protein R3D05_15480 [Dongiaceae bacterium]